MLAAQGGFFSVRATQGGEPQKAQARGSGAEVNCQRAATKGQQGHRWQERSTGRSLFSGIGRSANSRGARCFATYIGKGGHSLAT